MELTKLLTNANIQYKGALNNINIESITADSRKVQKNTLFIAVPGVKVNGTDFLSSAKEHGAVACIVPNDFKDRSITDLIYIPVDNVRKSLALLAAAFFETQPSTIVAVTGTNGKTSTANFCRQIWDNLNKKSASIGTLGVITSDFSNYGSMTTPDSITLHQEMSELENKGYHHLAFEASSHGIEQNRIDGIKIASAGFTNITRDHLDYHKTMENYLNAKLGLFDRNLSSNKVVLNADIPEFNQIKDFCLKRNLTILDYGFNAKALKILSAEHTPTGQNLKLKIFDKEYNILLPLVGTFQAMNALCSLGLCLATIEDNENIDNYVAQLENLKGAPGRMDYIGSRKNGASVYVDYAHTPDALENVLNALRPHTQNKLHVVFGCGGDRDTGKRPQMGAICEKLADVAIVTDDNPRSEAPYTIRDAILPACPKGINIGNRKTAIETAVANLEAGDILVVCGKGHEIGQMIKGVNHPFDDRVECKEAIIKADLPLWTAKEIAKATNAQNIPEDFEITGISIDSRTIKPGDLYIALVGQNTDGHKYCKSALEKGAAGVLVCQKTSDIPDNKTILVSDTSKALIDIAKASRKRSNAKIIGITGSSGKTSTKEMLKIALSSVGKTHTTLGNLNNNIGLPLTLARMPKDCEFAVLEMGISHVGEMSEMTNIANPDIVMITMIGTAHCEFFPTPADTAKAKGEIFEGMTKNGIAYLNYENDQFDLLKSLANKVGITDIRPFGFKQNCFVKGNNDDENSSINITIENKNYNYSIKLPGNHQLQNSLGVVGILYELTKDKNEDDFYTSLQSLSRLLPTNGRGLATTISLQNGTFTLLDDAYNASPDSMIAGLNVLGSYKNNRKIAVIGDMLELGNKSLELHLGLKEAIIDNKIDLVFAVGKNMSALFDTLDDKIKSCKSDNSVDIIAKLKSEIKSGDVVLVKGSHGSKMDLIVDALKA
ncbi:MAG: UDP-N-acetylmuramoyl-L-alanyl-D-glutamate--2,6-diaminopimelate ligase [Alphaproteobacteria bacterium]|nr:UDP-N-acetylmuramoyl-L-alanyl-D-glutamate--2,6-diaminopimelate ligase [Alphaproteobacteria bacterium]